MSLQDSLDRVIARHEDLTQQLSAGAASDPKKFAELSDPIFALTIIQRYWWVRIVNLSERVFSGRWPANCARAVI